jgi:hypothetical protein
MKDVKYDETRLESSAHYHVTQMGVVTLRVTRDTRVIFNCACLT